LLIAENADVSEHPMGEGGSLLLLVRGSAGTPGSRSFDDRHRRHGLIRT